MTTSWLRQCSRTENVSFQQFIQTCESTHDLPVKQHNKTLKSNQALVFDLDSIFWCKILVNRSCYLFLLNIVLTTSSS